MNNETTDNNALKGCVIKRTWFDQARTLLKDPAARCQFYEALMELSFDMPVTAPTNPSAFVMFSMCSPYINEDKEKYIARCARNRLNASSKSSTPTLRVAASGTESQRVAPNNNINTNINTNNNTNNNNENIVSSFDERAEAKEKFELIGLFFRKCAMDPVEEYNRFFDYYESTGWKNSKGTPIVSRYACAKMWRLKGDVAAEENQRSTYWEAFKTSQNYDLRVWTAYLGMRWESPEGKPKLVLRLKTGPEWPQILERDYIPQLRTLIRLAGAEEFRYDCMPPRQK